MDQVKEVQQVEHKVEEHRFIFLKLQLLIMNTQVYLKITFFHLIIMILA